MSGLCSLAVVGMGYSAVLQGPAALGNLVAGLLLVGVVGGVPFAIGVALMIAGRAIMRSPSPPGP